MQSGRTALHLAVQQARLEAMAVLERLGAEVVVDGKRGTFHALDANGDTNAGVHLCADLWRSLTRPLARRPQRAGPRRWLGGRRGG